MNPTIKTFDNYEISPCTRTEQSDKPGQFYFEVCEPAEADVWTLYGHIPGEGVEAIGDFTRREDAEEAYQRITGQPFGSQRENEARVRLMHAAQELLAYAECSAALSCEQAEGKRRYDPKPVLRSHGWNGEESIGVFLARIRRDAMTKATGHYLKAA